MEEKRKNNKSKVSLLSFLLIITLISSLFFVWPADSQAKDEQYKQSAETPIVKSEVDKIPCSPKLKDKVIAPEEGAEYDGFIVAIKDESVDKIDDNDISDYQSTADNKYVTVSEVDDSLEFADVGEIDYIEPNYKRSIKADFTTTPNDAKFSDQYELQMIKAQAAWDRGYSGKNVHVGVFDTGLYPNHEDIKAGQPVNYYDYTNYNKNISSTTPTDASGHGTNVTGLINANTNNGKGIASTAYDSSVSVFRAMASNTGSSSDFINGLIHASNAALGLDVINMSLGGEGYSLTENTVLQKFADNGTILVSANGNESGTVAPLEYPSNYSCVIAVGSVNSTGTIAPNSSKNTAVDVAAPGVSIQLLSNTGTSAYTRKDGTSFASPIVAAGAALIKEIHPNITVEQFRTLIVETSSDAGIVGYDTSYGYGILNLDEMTSVAESTNLNDIANTYSISYLTGDATMNDTNAPKTYSDGMTSSLDLPTNVTYDNKTFLGWCEDPYLEDTPKYALPIGSSGDKNLYPKFEIDNVLDMSKLTGDVNIEKHNGKTYAIGDNNMMYAVASSSDQFIITGSTSVHSVWIKGKENYNITLRNVNINLGSSLDYAAILLNNGPKVTMTLEGVNTLMSGGDAAGIEVYSSSSTLDIYGPGSLNAVGKGNGAGIGSYAGDTAGKITIHSGTINAQSNGSGTGIGAGYEGKYSGVEIRGGFVTAKGTTDIGGTKYSTTLTKTQIAGGSIYAVNNIISPAALDSAGTTPVYRVSIPEISNGVNTRGNKKIVVNENSVSYEAFTVTTAAVDEHGLDGSTAAYIYLPAKEYSNIKVGNYKEGNATVIANPTGLYNTVSWDYIAKFNTNGGNNVTPSQMNITNGQAYGYLPTPTHAYKDFVGWFTSPGNIQIETTTVVDVTESIELFAHWTDKYCTITFDADGGTSGLTSKAYVCGNSFASLPIATKSGFVFAGWYSQPNGTGDKITETSTVPAITDHTLYAHWANMQFDVSLDATDGTVSPDTINVTYGNTYGTLPEPTRTGYDFDGWYTASSGGIKITSTSTVNDVDVKTLYAQWTPKSCSITLNAKSGTVSPNTIRVTYNETYGTIPQPTRTGYNFDGWYTADIGGSKVTLSTKYDDLSVTTLYAHWTAKTYTINLNPNGGSVNPTSIDVTYDARYDGLPNPTRTGYDFDGWYTSLSGGTYISIGSIVNDTSITDLYARWRAQSFSVSFDANGGSVSPTSKDVTYDATYGTLPEPTRSNYIFNGWYTSSTGGTRITETTPVNDLSITKLYAQWTYKIFNVNLDANGGSVTPNTLSVTYGNTYGTLPEPTRAGYDFSGWYTAASGGTKITSSSTVNDFNIKTLYARWTVKNYSIALNADGGSVSPNTISVTYNSAYGTLPTPTKTNYNFSGWYTAASGGTKVTASTTFNDVSITTLYARWTAKSFTVSLNANGGSLSQNSINVSVGSTFGTLPEPTKTGYTFNGWFSASTGGTKITSNTTVDSSCPTTLYAQWKANTYKVTLNPNGGNISSRDLTVTYDSTYAGLNNPTKTGYNFAGWFTSSGTRITPTSKVTITGDITLHAKWTIKTFTINYNANKGKLSTKTKTVTYGNTIGKLATPKRKDYNFLGWYTKKTGGTQITQYTKYTALKDITIYAKWTKKKVVKFNANGGTVSSYAKAVKANKKYGKLPTPKRNGYKFKGWYTKKSSGKKVTKHTKVKSKKNHTLYAKWVKN